MKLDNPNGDAHEAVLNPALSTLRAEVAQLSAPASVEQALMAACAARFTPRPWYKRWTLGHWGMAGGVGSAAVMVMALVLTLRGQIEPVPLIGQDERGAFIALDTLERIAQEDTPQVIQTELPRNALESLGVAVTPENAHETVRAEMLVAADGAPLALRLSALEP